MCVGAFMCSLLTGDTTSFTAVQDHLTALGSSFSNVSVFQGFANVLYQGAAFVITLASVLITFVTWDFWFFNNFEWIRTILISVNTAIFLKILYDLYRLAKPFGT